MKYIRAFLVGSALLILGSSVLYLLVPSIRSSLRAEDKLVETVSATVYLLTAVTALVLMVQRKEKRTLSICLLIVGGICFLEEVSFGQRLIGFPTPYIAGVRIDGIHDIAEVGLELLRAGGPVAMAVAICIVAMLGIAAFLCRKRLVRLAILAMRSPVYIALLIFVALIGLSVVLDVRLIRFRGRKFIEEIIELNAALALLFACFCVFACSNGAGEQTEPGASSDSSP